MLTVAFGLSIIAEGHSHDILVSNVLPFFSDGKKREVVISSYNAYESQ
jgi:hypothetical protein